MGQPANHLGSSSAITDATGTVFEENLDYYPYGGIAFGTSSDHYLFTDKERDSESGLDSFGFRYYNSSTGRFASPDHYNAVLTKQNLGAGGLPAGAALGFLAGYSANPQNWNQYSYVRNNPLNFVDPTGAASVPDGHHLFSERDDLSSGLARSFTNAIKTGRLSGNGFPNQPGFNAQHIAYNQEVEQVLEDIEKTAGDRNSWSISQWKDAASQILNSTRPAIRDFLDELEANNPGARAALSAAVTSYRLSRVAAARIIAAALADSLSHVTLILFVNLRQAFRPPEMEADRQPPHKRCLMTREGQCVD